MDQFHSKVAEGDARGWRMASLTTGGLPSNEDGALPSVQQVAKRNGEHLIVPAIMEMSPRVEFSFVEELEHSYSNGDTLAPENTPEASGNSLAFRNLSWEKQLKSSRNLHHHWYLC